MKNWFINISAYSSSFEHCCGVLEVGNVSYFEDYEEVGVDDECVSKEAALNVALEELIDEHFHKPIVIMTDAVGGEAHKVMKLLKPKGYTKKYTYSKVPNPNSGNMLVMCTFIKQPEVRKKGFASKPKKAV